MQQTTQDFTGREIDSHRLRRLAYLSRMALGLFRRAPLPKQKIVFTVTNGRSGSARLSSLFEAMENVTSMHEPHPRFDTLMHVAHYVPAVARGFLRHVKLPAIARLPRPVYVETSHMFGKGYFDAMLGLGIPFSLILLRRNARSVALSMLRLGTIPGRTHWGRRFYMLPSEAQFVKLPVPARLTDYQLCYWHVRETEARQKAYGERARAHGLAVAEVDTDDLNKPGSFEALLATLGIEASAADLARIDAARGARVNEKVQRAERPAAMPDDIDAEEAAIDALAGNAA